MRKSFGSISSIRSQAYLIIVGAFVLGVLTGSLLMNLVVANTAVSKKRSMIEELTEELKLSSEQQSYISEIIKESRLQGKEVYKTIQPKIDDIRAQTKVRIMAVLDAKQKAQYEAWAQQVERRRESEKK